MNPLAAEFVTKAEADYSTALREHAAVTDPNHDAVCFHAQQCVEKLEKAVLVECSAPVPRTHDLLHLARLIDGSGRPWARDNNDLALLAQAAVDYRYPGPSATAQDAADTMAACARLRASLRSILGI